MKKLNTKIVNSNMILEKSPLGYTHEIWKNRHRHRSDISTYVTHLTRGTEEKNAFEILNEILTSGKLNGSNTDKGFIIGNNSAVCFQDIPLYGVSQNCLHEQLNNEELGAKTRYNPVGISFKKQYVFNKGGRPVFYEQKSIAKNILPQDEWWRIVSLDISNDKKIIDWTHEREWRVKGDFTFDIGEAVILLPRPENYKSFVKKYGDDLLKRVGGVVVLDTILS